MRQVYSYLYKAEKAKRLAQEAEDEKKRNTPEAIEKRRERSRAFVENQKELNDANLEVERLRGERGNDREWLAAVHRLQELTMRAEELRRY